MRYCPIIFAGSAAGAADFAFRALASQVRDIQRAAQSINEKSSAHDLHRKEKRATEPHSAKTRRHAMNIQFQKLPDSIKPEAVAAMLSGMGSIPAFTGPLSSETLKKY